MCAYIIFKSKYKLTQELKTQLNNTFEYRHIRSIQLLKIIALITVIS